MKTSPSTLAKMLMTQKAAVRKELASFGQLPPDWDGDEGHAPAANDLAHASAFLDYIPAPGVAAVSLVVAGDGDVTYEWKTSRLRLEVGFRRDKISFFGENRETGAEINGDYSVESTFPAELLAFMETAFVAQPGQFNSAPPAN